MDGNQFERWQKLREIVKTSSSMGEIYNACKEMVALQDGYTVNIIPLKPEDYVSARSLYKDYGKDKDFERRKKSLEIIREEIKNIN